MQVLPIHLQYSPRFWIAEAIAFPDCFSFDDSVPSSCHTLTLLLCKECLLSSDSLCSQSPNVTSYIPWPSLSITCWFPKQSTLFCFICFLSIACKVFRCHRFGWPSFPHSYRRLQALLGEEYVCGSLCGLHHITSTHCVDAKSVRNHAI